MSGSNLAEAYATSAFRKNIAIAQTLDSTGGIVWAADLSGNVILCEGGGLAELGLGPGETVGTNMKKDWPNSPWEEVIERLESGESHCTFITKGVAPEGTKKSEAEFWDGPWVSTYSYLRSPSGKPVGITVISISLNRNITSRNL